jgi:hypothetical protein
MQMSLPIRRNHIGKIWTSPLLSTVAKFAMRTLERSSSISVELRSGGLVEDALDIQLVTLFHSIITESTLTDYKIPLRVYYGLVSLCLPPYIDILKVVLFMSCSADLLDLEYI